jgi:asparagine synthase (glutamine-hydrolysing)
VALYGFTGSRDPESLKAISVSLAHRGATQTAGNLGGHTVEADQRVSIAWSGTLRPHPGSLLQSYRDHGIAFVKQLNGEFVIATQDGESLYLIRDAAGARTCCYGRHGSRWYVAAEPKGIWQLPGFSRRIRPAAVAQYFTYSFIPGSGTMLEDIWELPAGHYVHLRNGEPAELQRWFDGDSGSRSANTTEGDVPQRFRSLLEHEVASRLPETDQPVVFLSGGLDSSIVTAEVARQSRHPVRTFAIHFGRRYSNELHFARQVAERFGTDHEEVEISPKHAVAKMREMVWRLDDPIGDPVTAPNFELASHAAAQGATHAFNGEGGDPLFGGPKNLPMLLGHWYGGLNQSKGWRERRYLESYRRAYEELPYLLTPDFQTLYSDVDLHVPLTPFFESEGPFLHKLLAINTQLKGAHLILPKIERMLAASGVTPLSPMFTADMIRLAFSSPPNVKLRHGIEKWLMKEAYRDLLPPEIVARPKSGMRVPVHFWFKGPLRRYARSLLSRNALRQSGIFNPDRVQQWLKYDIEQPNGRYGLRLWMLLTFELWRRIVVENEPL